MDDPPSKKSKSDASLILSESPEKQPIRKPDPETAMQLYGKEDHCDRGIIHNHIRAFKFDKSKSLKSKKKGKL